MLGRAIDPIEAWLAPHSKAMSIVAAVWFGLGIAIYARFIRLPDWPWLPERALFLAGAVINAVWGGFLRPRPAIESRRKAPSVPEG